MKETFNFKHDLSPSLIDDMFQVCKTNCNLRHFQKLQNLTKNGSIDIILQQRLKIIRHYYQPMRK